MREVESPRQLLGLPDKPPKGAEPISDEEAVRISKAIGQPLPTSTEVVTMPMQSLVESEPKVLMMDRISGALETAGVTQGKIAVVLNKALDATKFVNIGDKAFQEVDDHAIRLTAIKEIKSLVGVSHSAAVVEETSTEEIMELFDGLSPEDMGKMRKKIVHKRKIVQSVPPSVSPMVMDNDSKED